MKGVELRLGRLFGARSGRSYVVALDHGLMLGAQPGFEDALAVVERSLAGRPDGVLISPGLLAKAAHLFGRSGAASPIVRLDWLAMDPLVEGYGDRHRVICSPRDAAALGADAVIAYLVLGPADGDVFSDNVAAIGQLAGEAHDVGLPLIVEAVAWGTQAGDRQDAAVLTYGCRTAVELGADAIKTEYTGDPDSMRKLVDSVPAPVLVLGGARRPEPEALYEVTEAALGAGAAGVVYGRNVWQADDPVAVAERIRALVHGD